MIAFIGCATPPETPPPAAPSQEPVATAPPAKASPPVMKPKPAPPKEAEREPPPPPPTIGKGSEDLRRAVQTYDDGDYRTAAKHFQSALDTGLLTTAEQVTARKHLAFIACVAKRTTVCRTEFRKALEVDPAFELSAAEAGHPTWGPVFRSVKAELTKKTKPAPPKPKPAPKSG
ncbi:MAG TPA: TssQ family T6SS-associated lipoprotein [Casimicrobiaceae bacterium]|nr:TssQ family T6SS-associated lipoprotein [Casimicrobiaceae bacterium]